jgi:hypothetical protein
MLAAVYLYLSRTLDTSDDPTYEDDNISVRPRRPSFTTNDEESQDESDDASVDAMPGSSS